MSHGTLIADESHLTPQEVEVLDARRRRGHLLLIVGLQMLVVTTLVGVLWAGLDLTHSPQWIHPMFYWCCVTGTTSIVCLLAGIRLRRGFHEFTSY